MLKYEIEIRSILCQILGIDDLDEVDVRDDLRIVGMDSLNCIELIVVLEERFDILIPDDKLGVQYVHNIYDICKLTEEMITDEQLQAI